MKKISLIIVIAAALGFSLGCFIGYSVFTVEEGERGVLANQAKVKILNPGLHFSWPWQQPTFISINNQVSRFSLAVPGGAENLSLAVMWNVADVSAFVDAGQNKDQVLTLLRTEGALILTPTSLSQTTTPASLSALILKALMSDPKIKAEGIAVVQVWVTGNSPSASSQAKILANMQGLATEISDSMIQSGEAQAEGIRNGAEQSFIAAQSAALNEAAQVLGAGNTAAVKTMAPLYHQNPALFKAYVAAKAKLLNSEGGQ